MLSKEAPSAAIDLGEDEIFVFPLSFAQQRLWFLDRLEPNSPAYNIPIPVRIRGPLNVPRLEQAIGCLLMRQEALRTVFQQVDGQPVQIIQPYTGAAVLTQVDLR